MLPTMHTHERVDGGDSIASSAHAPALPSDQPGRWRRAVLLHLLVFGGFVLLGVVLWWRVWITGNPSHTFTCQCGDPSQGLWFLTWTPWAIIHGHSPFLTNAIYAGQGGANMMVNTSWMLPSIVLAPITWLFGPIASFNVAVTVAPAISGWCFFVAARRVTTLVPAQILASLLYGFSPFVMQNDPYGHLNLTLLFFPPLLFVLLYDLLVTRRRSPARTGVWLAALVVAEFFTGTEILAICLLVALVTLVVATLLAPRYAWAQRARVGPALGVAAGIVLVVLAYPAWFIVAGPRRITGPPWANSPQLGTTASAVINPGVDVHHRSFLDVVGGYFGGVGPNSGPLHAPSLVFFGTLLIGFLIVSTFTWYRWRLAWTLVAGTVVAWWFSLGTTLGTAGTTPAKVDHAWWLPWRVFAHVPLLSDILPDRFGVMVTFGVAMLLAISLDRWVLVIDAAITRRRIRRLPESEPSRHRRIIPAAVMTVVGIIVLLPVAFTNSVPFTVVPSAPPTWFAAESVKLPAGAIVLVVPFEGQQAMGWQAQFGLHFALAGGFAVVPEPDGRSVFVSPPTGAVGVLSRLPNDPGTAPLAVPPSSAKDVVEVRRAIVRWKVAVTVVVDRGIDPYNSAQFLTAVYGRAPTFSHGAWVWRGSPKATAPPHPPGTLTATFKRGSEGSVRTPCTTPGRCTSRPRIRHPT